MPKHSSDRWLERAMIETGIDDEPVGSTCTRTLLRDVHIVDGAFAEVVAPGLPRPEGATSVDGSGRLMMPAFRDMHLHLDKTIFGGPFRTPIPGRVLPEVGNLQRRGDHEADHPGGCI